MNNLEVRTAIRNAGLYQWQVGEYLGLSESAVCRKLRKELTNEERERFLTAIRELEEKQWLKRQKAKTG